MRRITATRPDARSYVLDGEDAAALIADVVAALPIPHAYGLLVARADPADGRVRLSSEPLFPEGARRGASAELSVRSEEENRLVFAVVTLFGAGLDLNQWVLDVSPFTHVPKLPGHAFTAVPLLWLLAVAAVLSALGLLGLRRRDLATA
ncbi:hypothetical protein GCM10023178_38580 [Actinomadura luteofluorescens]